MFPFLRAYRSTNRNILNLFVAETCVQLVNATFILLLLIYMNKCGFTDYESAHYMKFRFLGVLALAIPVGIFIRKRNIKPLFITATLMVPVSAIAIIYSVTYHITWLNYTSHLCWGVGFVLIQVTAIPFVLRQAPQETRTESISLMLSTWSVAGITAGIVIYSLKFLFPQAVNEGVLMFILSTAGLAGFYFALRIKEEPVAVTETKTPGQRRYDWGMITYAMVPTTMIAVGAGLTIPFISLFFYKIHGLASEKFSLLSTFALVVVAYAILKVPAIKKSLGYRLAIPVTQGISIMALVGLASTELFRDADIAVFVAGFFYLCRQPLMNMAQPMTTEVTMAYVGDKNREMVSALTAAVWSGGWFISSIVFEKMRMYEFKYSSIFLLTAGFYAIGVVLYYFLTVAAEREGKI